MCAGGPLHLGDIEVLPDLSLCLRCPWHKWTFSLGRKVCGSNSGTRRTLFVEPNNTSLSNSVEPSLSSGTCLHPPGRTDLRLSMYPVRIEDRDRVSIGFKSLHINTLLGQTFWIINLSSALISVWFININYRQLVEIIWDLELFI